MLDSIKSTAQGRLRFFLAALIATTTFAFTPLRADARQFAVKTNLLYDATLTVNLGVEMKVAPRWSVDLSGNYNAWALRGHRWKHWMIQPEARYWLCDATAGHFLAAHALGGQFNAGHLSFARDIFGLNLSNLKDHRYQGWAAGVGVGYGYSWLLGKHWNIEAEIAVGWIYAHYDVYRCQGCGARIGKNHKNLVTPTKAALNLVYVF